MTLKENLLQRTEEREQLELTWVALVNGSARYDYCHACTRRTAFYRYWEDGEVTSVSS